MAWKNSSEVRDTSASHRGVHATLLPLGGNQSRRSGECLYLASHCHVDADLARCMGVAAEDGECSTLFSHPGRHSRPRRNNYSPRHSLRHKNLQQRTVRLPLRPVAARRPTGGVRDSALRVSDETGIGHIGGHPVRGSSEDRLLSSPNPKTCTRRRRKVRTRVCLVEAERRPREWDIYKRILRL